MYGRTTPASGLSSRIAGGPGTTAPLQDAVRSLLYKMGYEVVELPDNREKTTFDGEWLYKPVMPGNLKLAPKAFARIEPHVTPPLP